MVGVSRDGGGLEITKVALWHKGAAGECGVKDQVSRPQPLYSRLR